MFATNVLTGTSACFRGTAQVKSSSQPSTQRLMALHSLSRKAAWLMGLRANLDGDDSSKPTTGLEGITSINVWDQASSAIHELPSPVQFSTSREVSPTPVHGKHGK